MYLALIGKQIPLAMGITPPGRGGVQEPPPDAAGERSNPPRKER